MIALTVRGRGRRLMMATLSEPEAYAGLPFCRAYRPGAVADQCSPSVSHRKRVYAVCRSPIKEVRGTSGTLGPFEMKRCRSKGSYWRLRTHIIHPDTPARSGWHHLR